MLRILLLLGTTCAFACAVKAAEKTPAEIVIRGGTVYTGAEAPPVVGDVLVGPIWGLDREGEVRAMWRSTSQPGFWLMGGSLQQCRPYSKYLALQIKAREVGLR